jgi:hypothetical protein
MGLGPQYGDHGMLIRRQYAPGAFDVRPLAPAGEGKKYSKGRIDLYRTPDVSIFNLGT